MCNCLCWVMTMVHVKYRVILHVLVCKQNNAVWSFSSSLRYTTLLIKRTWRILDRFSSVLHQLAVPTRWLCTEGEESSKVAPPCSSDFELPLSKRRLAFPLRPLSRPQSCLQQEAGFLFTAAAYELSSPPA